MRTSSKLRALLVHRVIVTGFIIGLCALAIFWINSHSAPDDFATASVPGPLPVPPQKPLGSALAPASPINVMPQVPGSRPATETRKQRVEVPFASLPRISLAQLQKEKTRRLAMKPQTGKVQARLHDLAVDVIAAKVQGTDALRALNIDAVSRVNEGGAIQVYVRTKGDPNANLGLLKSTGLETEVISKEMSLVQGWAPAERIAALASLDSVASVELPDYARRRTGSVTSQGDVRLKANLVRSLGPPGPYIGSGIKVCVISDGCTNRATAIGTGDLPATGITMHPTLTIAGDEGTALCEIIYDLAPGAQLFAAGPDTSAEMVAAIQWAVAQGCHVIVDDAEYPGEPWFEDGTVAAAARDAVVTSGRVYVKAAGNDAQNHYQGTYSAITGDTWHDFDPTAAENLAFDFYLPANASTSIYLQWSDAFGASGNNYDMYIWDYDLSTLIGGSVDVQDGNDNPQEGLTVTNNTAVGKWYAVLIDKAAGSAKTLELFLLGNVYCDPVRVVSADSIYGSAAVTEVISVGAIDEADAGLDTIETFSSRGPSTISFPSTQTRQTPTITGVDYVSVTGAGGFGSWFVGTSASSSHIAAICALMLSKNPSATPTQIRTALTSGAIDKGTAGFDNTFGYGLADALASVNALAGSAMPEIAVSGNSVNIADGDATPATADHTDFGSVSVTAGTVVRTFTVANTGTANLTLGTVTVGGANAADFTVTAQPGSPVTPGNDTTFLVTFDPSAAGTRSATLSFSNNDADENPFNYSIEGGGIEAEIDVQGNSTSIVDGDSSPSLSDHTDFGSALLASGTIVRTYTIYNTGTATLNLTGSPRVAVSGAHAADFTVTTQPAASVAAGGSTTFQVTFDPSATGTRTAALSIANDDASENPYDYSIQGVGENPQVSVAVSPSSMAEDAAGALAYTFTRTGATTGALTAAFSVGGTATFSGDYTQSGAATFSVSSGTVTFAAGSATAVVNVDPAADVLYEEAETIFISIASGPGYVIGAPASATGTIDNDDTAPAIQWSAATSSVSEAATSVNVTATLSTVSGAAASAHVAVTGSADGADYEFAGLPLEVFATIPAGQTSATLTINLTNDSLDEADETIILTMDAFPAPPSNSTLGSPVVHTLTILDDDNPEIGVEQPAGTNLVDGTASVAFGSSPIGAPVVRTFTIRNTGTVALTGLAVTKDGANNADFTVGSLGATSVTPGGSTTFDVTFAPSASGTRTAAIHVASNDGDENPFDITLTGDGISSAGTLDPSFDPSVSIYINSLAMQLDGKILIGGQSTIRRLHSNGSTDTTFNPSLSFSPYGTKAYACAVQSDGKIIVVGRFSSVNGVSCGHVARLNADGTVDGSFNCSVGGVAPETISVNSAVVQPDGKIIIAGGFFTVNGLSRGCIARLNADGTLDTSFNPNANTSVFAVALQTDGKIVIGGHFTTVGGVARNRVARLNTDGTLDGTFNPGADAQVNCITIQADQKIIVAGYFTSLGGVSRGCIGRLDSAGVIDAGFNPNANDGVRCVTCQADGRLLVGGTFTTIGGTTRNRIARLSSSGALDLAFNPNVAGGSPSTVYAISLQGDGQIAIGGFFTTVGGVARDNDARLFNDAATQTLSVSSSSRVEWLRGGTSPEAQNVTFETSTDGGASWSLIGNGSRIAGGWEQTGLALPASGYLRARARTPGADFGGSSGLVEAAIAYGGAVTAPEIAVEQPAGTGIADGGSKSFGAVAVGGSSSLVFTINNTGLADLTGLTITKEGDHPSDFTITATPVAPVSGPSGSTFLMVQFTPGGAGVRSAVLHLANNDADEDPFDITITGTGLAPEIAMSGNSVNIADGDATPSTADHTDFGSQAVASGTVVRTFTIQNDGTADLTLGTVTVGGTHAADFTVSLQPVSPVAAAGSTTFQVTFNPSALGLRSATLSLSNNDADENPFDFSIQGTGTNTAPTDIALSAASIAENNAANATVGTLSATDADAGDTQGFTLVAGTGSTDNASFTIAGAALSLTPSADFETKSSYSVRVGTNDGNGGTFEKPFTITITNVNEVPSFTKGADQTHPSGTTAAQSISGWATAINDGDSTVTQALTFNVTVTSGSGIFTNAPSVSSTGTLTYTPNGTAGTANISVTLTDDNTAGGAALTSAAQTFAITVNSPVTGAEIAVEQPAGTDLADGGASIGFGTLLMGNSSGATTFTIRNLGTANLTGLAISKDGANTGDFIVSSPGGTTLAPNASTTFTVVFSPKGIGSRTAAIHIASNDSDENPFDISVSGLGTTKLGYETESNNTAATANPLAGGATGVKITGNIFPVGDVDYYSFSAQAGDRVYAAVMTAFSPGSQDSQLSIIGADGTTVLEFDEDDGTFGSTSSSIAGLTVPSSGTFFVRVNEKTGAATIRPYSLWLSVRTGSPTPETESNDTFPGQSMPPSFWVSGNTSSASDLDYFSLNLNAGDTAFISLDLDPERDGVTWDGWMGLGAFGNPLSTLLASDGNITSPNSEAFFLTVKDAGAYAVRVQTQSGATSFGTYHLSVCVLPAAGLPSSTYASSDIPKSIPDGASFVTSTITIPDNKRVGKLKVALNITHNLMQDLDISLTAPDGNVVGLVTDRGSSTAGTQTGMNLLLDDDAAVPPNFSVTSGLIFQPEASYRMEWFKGQQAQGTWTLTLRDDLATNTGTLNNWSLVIEDEETLPPGVPTVIYANDFEVNDGGFTHSGTADEWQRGLPAFAPITTANSGVNCWKTDLTGAYQASSSQDLFSPNIDLSAAPSSASMVFSWAMKFQLESATFDQAFIEVQEVGGAGATRKVWEWTGATMTNPEGNPSVTTNEAAGWGVHRALISDFAGKTIRLRFHVDSDTNIQLAGLAIDDVSVTSYSLTPVPTITSLSVTSGQPGDSIVITGTNFSTTPTNNIVWFGGVRAAVTAATATQLTVTVPAGSKHDYVQVTVGGKTAASPLPFLPTFSGEPGLSASSYASPLTIGASGSPTYITTGDIDGDGKSDVVMLAYTGQEVQVHRNLLAPGSPVATAPFTAGALAAPVSFGVPLRPLCAALGDLNGDGRLDVVVSDYSTGTTYGSTASVLINTSSPGSISFAPYFQVPCGASPQGVAIADLNGDGRPEILVADSGYNPPSASGNTLSVLVNNFAGGTMAAGDFQRFTLATGAGGNQPRQIGVGDLDGDSKPEIIVANSDTNNVVVFGNHSTSASISAATFDAALSIAASTGTHDLALVDYDRDGDMDLTVTNYYENSLTVLRNTGSGTLSSRFVTNQTAAPLPGDAVGMQGVGDLDGDGFADLTVPSGSGFVSVLRNQPVLPAGNGWSFAPRFDINLGTGVNGGNAVMDLDADGRPDLITGSYQGGMIFLIRNITPPPVPVPTIASLSATGGMPGDTITITGTDFNTTPGDNIVWFGGVRGVVTAATATQLTVTVPFGAAYGAVTVQTGGKQAASTHLFVPRFDGDGSLVAANFTLGANRTVPAGRPAYIMAADFDNDGRNDVAVVNYDNAVSPPNQNLDHNVSVFRNTSTPGTLDSSSFVSVPVQLIPDVGTHGGAAGDLNGDGRADIVTFNLVGGSISVFENISSGPGVIAFAAPVTLPVGNQTVRGVLADYDGDGRLDIVAGHSGASGVSVFRNRNLGGNLTAGDFIPDFDIGTGGGESRRPVVGDWDGDGLLDLAVGQNGPSPDVVTFFRNTGVGAPLSAVNFATGQDLAFGEGLEGIKSVDFDLDGKHDVVAVSYTATAGGNTLWIARNSNSPGSINPASFSSLDFPASSSNGFGLDVGDLNGDGKPDMATCNYSHLALVKNTSTAGVLNASSLAAPQFVSGSADSVVVVDLDNDGRPDLLTSKDLVGWSYFRNSTPPAAPEIAVEQPSGTDLVDDTATVTYSASAVGSTSSKTFTVRNIGTASLTGVAVTKDGTNSADFSLGALGATTLAPGGSTTFTVTFAPPAGGASGVRVAAIHIESNDSDENPFDIALSATALSTTTDTDNDGMNDWGEYQLATLGFDWQADNTALVGTYFSAANSNGLYTPAQVQALHIGAPLIQRDSGGIFTLTIGIEKSTDLTTWTPFPFVAPQTTINGQGKVEFQFTVPDDAAFFQLRAP